MSKELKEAEEFDPQAYVEERLKTSPLYKKEGEIIPEPEKEGEKPKDEELNKEETIDETIEQEEVEQVEAPESEGEETEQIEPDNEDNEEETPDDTGTKESDAETVEPYSEEKIAEIVEAYAVREGITEEAAREAIEKDIAIAKEFGNDPIKLARSTRENKSYVGKLQNQIKELEEKVSKPKVIITDGGVQFGDNFWNKEYLITDYRKKDTDYEDLDDEVVYKLIKKSIESDLQKQYEDQQIQTNAYAETRRQELIAEIREQDKKFLPEVKELLKNIPAEHIASPTFNIQETVSFIKGMKYDEDIKKAREEAYKRGRESKKILGEKTPIGSGSNKPKGEKAPNLTSKERENALRMYSQLSEVEALKAYAEQKAKHPNLFKNM